MKRIALTLITLVFTASLALAEVPHSEYLFKTQQLADEFVKCSMEGNYKKTYKAIRKIQKFVQRLDNEQIFDFIEDIDTAVGKSCSKYGLEEMSTDGLKEVVYAILPDALKAEAKERGLVK